MDLYCGTSGFSYAQWRGAFYPEKLPAKDMLASYAERLPSVEINNTFYRMPKKDVLAGWRNQVPDHFRFAIKAPRRISHSKRLVNCADEVGFLVASLDALGDKLGVLLVQLPPYFRMDTAILASFLELVPERIPLAFEFRHASWQDETVVATLAARGAAFAIAENDGKKPNTVPQTAALTYLRLRAPTYSAAVLRAWHKQCARFERAFVYFKHEDGAIGPALAQQMQALSPDS